MEICASVTAIGGLWGENSTIRPDVSNTYGLWGQRQSKISSGRVMEQGSGREQNGWRAKRLYQAIRGSSCSGAMAASWEELNRDRNAHRRSTGCRNKMSESTYTTESTSFRISCMD
ncbi:hypothetical protein EYF80_016089 [Liparis tanakae]|uniref:Uncharacterized protein n=1 Tax=Liparis tanakae TaxID=230148 RepID=A0A4Z2I6M1_9TELE|nr:hypothetical protein EYF80_016089 [Liparis tanakae]